MDATQKAQLKRTIEKLIGRGITDAELNGIIMRYARSVKTGEDRLVESIANETRLPEFAVRTKLAAADDTNRVKKDIVDILNNGTGN